MNTLQHCVRNLCSLLEKHDVQYIIVGGASVALNGYYRHTVDAEGKIADKPDIDIWYNPTYRNYYRLLNVIEELGEDVSEFRQEKSPKPHQSFFKLNIDAFTLDFLPRIKAKIKFDDAYGRREVIEFEKTNIQFLNYSDLIADKAAAGRKKDIEDIRQLKKLKE